MNSNTDTFCESSTSYDAQIEEKYIVCSDHEEKYVVQSSLLKPVSISHFEEQKNIKEEDSKCSLFPTLFETVDTGKIEENIKREKDKVYQQKEILCCKKCGNQFLYMEDMKGYIYSCDCDDLNRLYGELFQKHIFCDVIVSETTDRKIYCCRVCNKKFVTRNRLVEHINSHTGMKPFKCKKCGKGFTQRSSLYTHFQKHSDVKPHQCHVCGKSYHVSTDLRVHLRTHDKGIYMCVECEKVFDGMKKLRAHMKCHAYQPLTCDICDKKFVRRTGLRKHMFVHAGYKPYKCQFCGKRFTQSYNLRTHSIIHTGLRAFKCPVCERCFGLNQSLKSHMKIHERDIDSM